MHETIGRSLSAFELGEVQRHANMAVVPILWPKSGGPDYLTMKEALEKAVLVVTEVSEGGSVPNLKVANKGDAAKAKAFLAEAAACEEKIYDSVGMGKEYRYSGPRLVGSALAVEDAVIHTAFFRVTESEQAGNMATMNRRRSFRV